MPSVVIENGLRLEYGSVGDGFPLLLIAGLGRDRGMWSAQIDALSSQYRVVTFDNRGVGGSDRPSGPYTIAHMADDAAQLLDALDIARAHVLGASLGGMIAQELERRNPERVATLTLLCTTPGLPLAIGMSPSVYASIQPNANGDPLQTLTGAMRLAHSNWYWELNEEHLKEAARRRLADPIAPQSWWTQAAAGAGFSSLPRAPQVPCLVMTGEDDLIVPPVNSERLAARITDVRLERYLGGGHYFFVEEPDAVNGAILEFLAPHTPGSHIAGNSGRGERNHP
ncbi:MAG: 3-oxoadipate enol-lactone hydrolase [Elusimicrobia bacterium]|nr:MAG: 3-oxoadipate enol-lactone hydrolase [Elusimicrobiota bacterium]